MSKLTKNSPKIDDIFLDIFKYLEADLKNINDIIINNCSGDASLTTDIAKHIVLSGGKRVRPVLTILSAKICGYKSSANHHHNLAAAVELIHTATLLHDDVVDDSDLRRGKKTANAIWGNKASILVGDYLLSTAFQLMVKSGSLEVLDLLSNTSRIMANGEVMQLMNSSDIEIAEEKYLQIISQKTAILFAAATAVGAIISNSGKEKEQALQEFGNNLGIAFQIMDDVLDYSSSKEILGKEIGDDFFEGKITLPIIITYNKASKPERERISEIFNHNLLGKDKDQNQLKEVMDLMKKYQAIDIAYKKALEYQQKAIKNLQFFPDAAEKEMLISILGYAIGRSK